ncbi:MAG: phosphoribosylformylglycinamidine synthase subunit PurQ [Clostridia bacterium]|jgi:phosphoribosylformylglycinamidine synthase I|nr:phosphoribosylformylglycinamidine synthase subunit PurQ [Clostridiales bacterium]
MKFGVVVFPGSNCDIDCYHALRDVLDQDTEYIWHMTKHLGFYDCIVLPGGFSYGSYLRGGAIARFSPVMDRVVEFAQSGKPVIGISNGFQVLTEAGLLPGAFLRNNSMKFVCENVYIRTENASTPFTKLCGEGQVLKIPIAHGDGNYYVDDRTLKDMEQNNQVVFRYCDAEGEATAESNPNGSLQNIAGICNREGNVVGMMPHPERCMEEILGNRDGTVIFKSVINYLKGGAVND